jgi:hypothetical protein
MLRGRTYELFMWVGGKSTEADRNLFTVWDLSDDISHVAHAAAPTALSDGRPLGACSSLAAESYCIKVEIGAVFGGVYRCTDIAPRTRCRDWLYPVQPSNKSPVRCSHYPKERRVSLVCLARPATTDLNIKFIQLPSYDFTKSYVNSYVNFRVFSYSTDNQAILNMICSLGRNRTCILGTGNPYTIHCTTRPSHIGRQR